MTYLLLLELPTVIFKLFYYVGASANIIAYTVYAVNVILLTNIDVVSQLQFSNH